MQPGDAIVALDLLLALGAFALKGEIFVRDNTGMTGILPFPFEKE